MTTPEVVTDLGFFDKCNGIVCDICCYEGYCITDQLVCQVQPKDEFSTIVILAIVVAGLLLGMRSFKNQS